MMKHRQQRKDCFNQRNVVIIGATGGLGVAFTDMFLNEGANVFLGIRSEKKLSGQYRDNGERVKWGILDIQLPDTIKDFADKVKEEMGYVDFVINATGYDVRKGLLEHSAEEILKSIDINLAGSIFITKSFLKLLKEQPESTIVHMGGFVDGGLAFPYYSVDVATRSGMYSFCESINRELIQEKRKYHLTYFCPNPANTKAELPYHPIWKEMKVRISSPEEVARALRRALINKKKISIMGGVLESGFAKLNHLSVSVSNFLLMKKYSSILKKYFGAKQQS